MLNWLENFQICTGRRRNCYLRFVFAASWMLFFVISKVQIFFVHYSLLK